jgi:predicted acetyltransferase
MFDVVHIWGRCFGNDDLSVYPFLSRYFFYQCAMMEKVDGKVVSMVFMIPCQSEFGMGAYLYAIATDPDCQHRGISTRLIYKMLDRCKDNGAAFSFLIPAEPSLIDYYSRFGYQTTDTIVEFQCDLDLGTGDKEKDRIVVLPLNSDFRIEELPDTLVCQPML